MSFLCVSNVLVINTNSPYVTEIICLVVDLAYRQYFLKLVNCMAAALGTFVASLLACLLVALCLNALERTMSWYARPIWVFFLYVIPTMLVCIGTIYLHAKKFHKVSVWRV